MENNELQSTAVYFLGIKFSFLQFVVFFIIWFFLLTFIWPIFLGSYFFVLTFLAAIPAILTGTVFRFTMWLLLLLHWINKKVAGIFHVFLLIIFTFLVVWIYDWFEPMETLSFINLFIIELFSAFLISKFITQTTKWNERE